MANRRWLDSSHYVATTPAPVTTNSKIITSHLQLKQVLLTLAFVSSLLSIHCASFDKHLLNKRQVWRHNQPEYRILVDPKDELTSQDGLSNEWPRPGSGYEADARLGALPVESIQQIGASGNELDPLDYYLTSSRHSDLSNDDERRQQEQQIYQELALAHLFDLTKQQEDQRRQSSLFDNNILPSSQSFNDQTLPNSDLSLSSSFSSSNLLDYEQPNYNSKQLLAALLQGNGNKRDFDALTNQQIIDLATTNFNMKYNPKSSLNLSPDQSPLSSSSTSPKIDDRADQRDNVIDESQQSNVLDENRLFDNTDNSRKDPKHDDGPKKFTTLLEDEEIDTSTSQSDPSSSPSSSSSSNLKQTEVNQQAGDNKLSGSGNKIYYGKVVNNDNATTGYSLTSMLSGVYNKFANLLSLPSSSSSQYKEDERIAKIATKRDNHLSGQNEDDDKSSKITYGTVVENTNNNGNKSSISSIFKGLFNKVVNYLTLSDQRPTVQVREIHSSGSDFKISKSTNELDSDLNGLSTKHSVSKSEPNESKTKDITSDEDNHKVKDDQDDENISKINDSNGEMKKVELNGDVINSIDNDYSSKSGVNNSLKDNKDDTGDGNDNNNQQQQTTINSFRPKNPTSLDNLLPIDGQNSEQKVSLLRRSKMVLPMENDDQQTTGSDELNNNGHSVSLLGYYAPNSRHYRLNSDQFDTTPMRVNPNKAGLALNGDEQQVYSQLSHRSYSHRLHPGDDVYGSYSELRPIYAAHAGLPHETLSLVSNNKTTNDMYFLVMVSAFCVMAIAVVLAAGMFAYRVQQNRKLTTETDYPTYGVVGPNSMNTKCGASGFVGGYFGTIKGSASSSSDSKNGSAKHLADIYSGSDSGVTTSCKQGGAGTKRSITDQTNNLSNPVGSVSNRSDFFAGQNAARMYHYQHQKQQMIISDRGSNGRQTSASDLESEDENDDGSYTVYECPGLASAHEMEIKNPLFNDDQTP